MLMDMREGRRRRKMLEGRSSGAPARCPGSGLLNMFFCKEADLGVTTYKWYLKVGGKFYEMRRKPRTKAQKIKNNNNNKTTTKVDKERIARLEGRWG